jgi:predicted Rossmann fold flavoprotein
MIGEHMRIPKCDNANREVSKVYDVVIIGAGAAGLMCAAHLGQRARHVVLLEHQRHIGEKIRISGGGRCNFTNIHTSPQQYLSENPHFCRSALAGFTPKDMIEMLNKHGITYHEKTLGQLFCDHSSKQIITMLGEECASGNVTIQTECSIQAVNKSDLFTITTDKGIYQASCLVVATGGLSIPKLGASDLGYRIAQHFGLSITQTRPGLVPLTLDDSFFHHLSGIAVDSITSIKDHSFREQSLFTHRGLSGPAILQISSYWQEQATIHMNLLPELSALTLLRDGQKGRHHIKTLLNKHLPKRLSEAWCQKIGPISEQTLAEIKMKTLENWAHHLQHWPIIPTGTEGYAKAEVTLGGVATHDLSSKTMETLKVPGLFFIGEVVDVTGWLGGYNFQWAWASAVAAAKAIATSHHDH